MRIEKFMKLFINVQVTLAECFVLKEEREPLALIMKTSSHLLVEPDMDLLFLKYNYAHKISFLHEGSLKTTPVFPLNKKEKMIISYHTVKIDFTKGFDRIAPYPRLKESNMPVTFKVMARKSN